jgi:hypothetical protein
MGFQGLEVAKRSTGGSNHASNQLLINTMAEARAQQLGQLQSWQESQRQRRIRCNNHGAGVRMQQPQVMRTGCCGTAHSKRCPARSWRRCPPSCALPAPGACRWRSHLPGSVGERGGGHTCMSNAANACERLPRGGLRTPFNSPTARLQLRQPLNTHLTA